MDMPKVEPTDTYLGSVLKRPEDSDQSDNASDESDECEAVLYDMQQAILQGLVGVSEEGDEEEMEVTSEECLDWLRSEIARGLG